MFKRVALLSLTLIGIFSLTAVSFSKTWEDLTSGLNKGESKYEIMFSTSHIGHYKIEVEAIEVPSKEILPTDVVDESYFPKISDYVVTELDNLPPDAWYDKRLVTKVDVALAIGKFDQTETLQSYIPTFESLLESAGNGVDAYVEQVKTSTISSNDADAESIFSTWDSKLMNHGLIGFQGDAHPSDWTIMNNQVTSTVSERPGRAWLYPDYTVSGDMQISFRFGLNSNASDFGHGESGFFIKISDDGRYSYCIIIDNHSACGAIRHNGIIAFCKLNGDSLTELRTSTIPMFSAGDNYSFVIKIQGSDMEIEGKDKNNQTVFYFDYNTEQDNYEYPELSQGSFGFYVWDQRNAYFDNINITMGSKKSLGEAVSDVAWRDNSLKFVVYAEDDIPLELDTKNPDREKDYEYTIAKLLSSNTYLINLGKSGNKAALDKIAQGIKRPDDPETSIYYYNTPITSALNKAKDWILTKVRKQENTTDWILVGTEVKWDTHYTDSERDLPLNFGEHDGTKKQPQDRNDYSLIPSYTNSMTHLYKDTKVEAERWRYRHYYTFFDNYTIREAYHSQWIPDPVEVFNSTGKFRINYKRKDNPYNPDTSLTNLFNEYRYWSTHYDRKD